MSRDLVALCLGLLAAGLAAQESAPGIAPTPLAQPSRAKSSQIDRHSWTGTAALSAAIRRVVVRNDYGDVRARYAGDGIVSLHAVIQRLGTDPDVGINVERHAEVLTVTVVSPPGRVSVEQARLAKTDVDRVDLVIYVPAHAGLDAESLRGIVEARGLKSDVRAVTLDGDISVAVAGLVEARSIGGNVTVSMGKQGLGPAWVETRTGTIWLGLPAASDFRLQVETGGALKSEITLTPEKGAPGRRRALGTLGTGGRAVTIQSESGAVELVLVR